MDIRDEQKVVFATVFSKETDYGKERDYIGEEELSVTITLAEYRDLVADNARLRERNRTLEELLTKPEDQDGLSRGL